MGAKEQKLWMNNICLENTLEVPRSELSGNRRGLEMDTIEN